MRFFWVEGDRASGYSGSVHAVHRGRLPGIICPQCKATWPDNSRAYPSVDLTSVEAEADFETPRPEPAEEYERLCERLRPLLPPGALLEPGAAFGPLQGTARGRFGALVSLHDWWLLARREAVERLQAEGLRGIEGCRTALRFRQQQPPELLELEILPAGRLHADCLPRPRPTPCPRCGRHGLSLPDERLVDASTVPVHLDLFRLVDFSTVIVCSERFASTCQRLGLDGVTFRPLPVR
jgi:uncharacterized double-CXXCG motif protein